MGNEPLETDPAKLQAYKARQYDIILELVSWLLAEHRRSSDHYALLPLINTIGMWWDTQAEMGLAKIKKTHQAESPS